MADEGTRANGIERQLRQNCEAADHMSYAYGHHMLAYAAQSLALMAQSLEQGAPPQLPIMVRSRATVEGYLRQYDQWVTNMLNGYTSKESKLYEEAQAVLRDYQQRTINQSTG